MSRGEWLACSDESGGADQPPLALVCLGGPRPAMLALEGELKALLKQHGLDELKWARLRKRESRLACAADWLKLLAAAVDAGDLGVDVVVDRRRGKVNLERWKTLYHRSLRAQLGRWPSASWAFLPDRRTGIDWESLRLECNRRFAKVYRARRIRLRNIEPADSRRYCLVQAADLLAGLARLKFQPRRPRGQAGLEAEQNRRRLLSRDLFGRRARSFRLHLL